jgi:hypothetical protein
VLPLGLGRRPAELLPQELLVELRRVDEAVEAVGADDPLLPLGPEGLDGVGVAVDVDDLLLRGGDAVVRVLDLPDEVAEAVEEDVLGLPHRLDLDDLLPEVLEARELVVGSAAERVAALLVRLVDVVSRDSDRLREDFLGEREVLRGELGDAGVEGGSHGDGRSEGRHLVLRRGVETGGVAWFAAGRGLGVRVHSVFPHQYRAAGGESQENFCLKRKFFRHTRNRLWKID